MIRATVVTKVIDQEGQIDDETAIPHVGVALKARAALRAAFGSANAYIADQYQEMGTNAFDITVEIAPVRRDTPIPGPRTDAEPPS